MEDAQEHIARRTITHPIQLHVLEQLIFNKYLAYPQLVPDGLSGHAFGYHLRRLQIAGLVGKLDRGYTLTPTGRLLADAASFGTFKLKSRPVTGVFMRAEDPAGQILGYTAQRAPLYNVTTLPFGKLRLGETNVQTLDRMLERVGLTATDTVWSTLNVRYFDGHDLVCQRTGAFARVSVQAEPASRHTKNGSYVWLRPDQAPPAEANPASPDLDIQLLPS